jgi:transketolase
VISEASRKGPSYIRLNRAITPIINDDMYTFRYGEAVQLADGDDLVIFATGTMVHIALEAAEILHKERISTRVINNHTIKPLDRRSVISAARETGGIITIEKHSIFGGLGGAIADILCEHCPVPMKIIGVRGIF